MRLNYCLYCDVVFFVLLFCLCFFVFLCQDVFVHVRSCDSVFLCCLGLCFSLPCVLDFFLCFCVFVCLSFGVFVFLCFVFSLLCF